MTPQPDNVAMTHGPAGWPTSHGTLRNVLPTAASMLGVTLEPGVESRREDWGLPLCERVCVFLIDGLGDVLLHQHADLTPTMSKLRRHGYRLTSDFPATTATSMASLGTGLPPGAHGMMGYLVRNPDTHQLVNEIAFDTGVDPKAWQPRNTVFESCVRQDVDVVQIGPAHFDNSGLTVAALRGAEFVAAQSLTDRIDVAARILRKRKPVLVYVYWGDVDKIGHQKGVDSHQWRAEVSDSDWAVRTLVAQMPSDAVALVTADHGMVDVTAPYQVDLAKKPQLAEYVTSVGGDPRAPMLYVEDGFAEVVKERWGNYFQDEADVLLKQEAVTAGWFGAVDDQMLARVGDVVLSIYGPRSVHDGRTGDCKWHDMIGQHGARTEIEQSIPLIPIIGSQLG